MEKNYIKEQNPLIAELSEQVQNLKADNYALMEELKKQISSTEKNMSAVVEKERTFQEKITNEVNYIASSSALQIKEAAKTAMGEAVNQGKWKVKDLCEDSEKKIRGVMRQFDWLQEKTYLRSGFQKFFFWASPVLMFVQTILLVFALWG